jgi:putative SbcD/Mre11-related phosphoesterase
MGGVEIFPGLEISNERCAVMRDEGIVVIADLHLGFESVLEEGGLHLPRMQNQTMRDMIERIVERYSPSKFVILGDLKHEFSRNLPQEWGEVQRLLSLMQEERELVVVRGNHDNYLATISSRLGIDMVDEFRAGGIGFVHGHVDTSLRPLVMGHEHPSVRLFDTVGAYVKMPCFVHLPTERILVLPAFSPLASGTDFTGLTAADTLSPILKSSDLSDAVAYGCSDIGLLNLGQLSRLVRRKRDGTSY